MKEQKVNILSNSVLKTADAVCFTSNGVIKKNGCLVMGAGVAKLFRDTIVGIDKRAGDAVNFSGNICQYISSWSAAIGTSGASRLVYVLAFPTKHHWRDKSSLDLIEGSARRLMEIVKLNRFENVYLPRPGCCNGGLNWTKEVKPLLENILDDRVTITYL